MNSVVLFYIRMIPPTHYASLPASLLVCLSAGIIIYITHLPSLSPSPPPSHLTPNPAMQPPVSDAPWGIISVKGQLCDYELPMQPITVMRNALGR